MTVDRAEVEAAIARLDPESLAGRRWFGSKGRPIRSLRLAQAFDLDDGHALAVVALAFGDRGGPARYVLPLSGASGHLAEAEPGDGAYRALARAIAEGATLPAVGGETPSLPGPVSAALVCRPAGGLARLVGEGAASVGRLAERPLGADQSNTSVVLGERLVLKTYRRLEPGLNPDLELTAYLSEEVGFDAVPALAGFAELVTADGVATVAMLEEFVAPAEDAYESTAERLTAWLLAEGEVAVEFATEEAAEIGRLTADMHAAFGAARAPGFEPRLATRDELRGWWQAARSQLERALEIVSGEAGMALRGMAPAIADEVTVFEALPTAPLLTRVHGDYHLGQLLRTADGFVIVDFEGEPTRSLEERRRHGSPMRDVASMLRSIDHVGRSAIRRAEARTGGPLKRAGFDMAAWLRRSRERFLDAYERRLAAHGSPISVDLDLLRAFEIEKETYEFLYAATYLTEWMWAPLAGMRGLLDEAPPR